MQVRAVKRTRRSLLVPVIVPAMAFAGILVEPAPRPAEPTVAIAAPALELPPVSRPYQAAAVALRRGNFLGTLKALDKETERDDASGRHARLMAGLYAHALELPGQAAALLGEEPTVPGPLEDWRLWVLADARAAEGDAAGALAALDHLLGDWPHSPLVSRAVVRAVELARQDGQLPRAVALVELGRRRGLQGALAERLERHAWQLGDTLGDDGVLVAAGLRLLADHPGAADELGVPLRLAVHKLPSPLLHRRAEALLARGALADATTVLEAVRGEERDLAWHLLMARVLTARGKSADAVKLLAGVATTAPADTAQVEWARAQAALEQSTARRGDKRPVAERNRWRNTGLAHLQEAARLGDRELRQKALRQLFEEQAESERIDVAIATLRELRRLDPQDTTGAKFLWERGWRDYRARNYTGAVGYWTELAALAPRDRYPRSARYWSARAFEALGDSQRARALYAELAAADTTDFYRRHAVARLGGPAPAIAPASAATPPEPWPSEPRLARVRYLTDAGLDGLAAAELELLADTGEPRARSALQGMILARQGKPRESMEHLRNAFPALGTPLQAAVPALALELYYPLHYRDAVERWAAANDVPVPLVLGVVRQESAFDTRATSWAGARGLMQLMPGTAREVSGKLGLEYTQERLYDPEFSIRLGTNYLGQVLRMFDGEVELALAGYNSGPYRIKRLWREAPRGELDSFIESLPLEEPKTYVRRILLLSDSYSQLYPELAG
jgi:soluble lytic murein transglycosylase-like protein